MRIGTILLFFVFSIIACNNKQQIVPKSVASDNDPYIIENLSENNNQQYYVWLPILKVRTLPKTDAPLLAKIKKGDLVNYLGIKTQAKDNINIEGKVFEDHWMKIKLKNGIEGWVFGGGINMKDLREDLNPLPFDDCFILLKDKVYADFDKCMYQVSRQQIKQDVSQVSVSNGRLRLKISDGSICTFATEGNPDGPLYNYCYFDKNINYYVLSSKQGSGSDFLVVNASTGKNLRTWGFPKSSPDKKAIVSVNADFRKVGNPNGIQIISIEGKSLVVAWEREIEGFEPYLPRWLDNNTIGVSLRPLDMGRRTADVFALVKRQGKGSWKIEY